MERDRSPALGRPRERLVSASAIVVVAFFGALVVFPLFKIFQVGFADLGVDRLAEIVGRRSLWRVVRFTVWQAFLSTLLALLIGLPLAHVLSRFDVPFARLWRGVVSIPFVLPTVVVAGAIRGVADDVGIIERLPLTSILWAHVFFNLAVVVRIVGTMMASLDQSQLGAARTLGLSPMAAWRQITLRQLGPAIVSSALIVFLFCFTSYGVILVLGGPSVATIETEIRRYAIFRNELDVASVLALIQLVFVVGLSVASAKLRRVYEGRSASANSKLAVDTPRRKVGVTAAALVTAAVLGWPIVRVLVQSVRVGDAFGFGNFEALTEPNRLLPITAVEALGRSAVIGLAAALIAAIIGGLASFVIVRGGRIGSIFELAVLIPLGLSAVTIGFGYLLAFASFDLRRSPILVPLAHATIGIPFVLAGVVPVWRSIGTRQREAAATLGASTRRVFMEIEWPRVARALITGASFAFAVSLGEFGATSFLARGNTSFTAPLAIFRLLGQPGSVPRGQAMALCVVLGVVVAAASAIGDFVSTSLGSSSSASTS